MEKVYDETDDERERENGMKEFFYDEERERIIGFVRKERVKRSEDDICEREREREFENNRAECKNKKLWFFFFFFEQINNIGFITNYFRKKGNNGGFRKNRFCFSR